MIVAKRERGKIERRLIKALTHACESAKPDMPGFCWLTHVVDFDNFPDSLRVIWVFKTEDALAAAVQSGLDQPILEWTAQALSDADVQVASISPHVGLDSEQQCQREHSGNWERRLKDRTVRH